MRIKILLALFVLCNILHAQKPFTNPALNQDFADPTVILAPDGNYYAYATQSSVNGKMNNIQVASSNDLFHWKYEGDALPVKPSWASHTQDYWAPHVLYDASIKQYVMFYCAKANDTAYDKCIGVAFSKNPLGPFTDKGEPLIAGRSFQDIDPMAMIDPVTKKKILYWGSGFAPISVRELNDDWRSFKQGSAAIPVVLPNKEKTYSTLIEGAWVDYHDGKYYLYYSGDNCCGDNANYAVMVARADHWNGPFTLLGDANKTGSSVVLAKDSIWFAPGHNSIVHDKHGNIFIAYHAIWKNEADAERQNKKNKYVRRVMCMQPVVYKNGWPVIEKKY
jgi:arabinan endo-1,5-alpha-L-arabinosidase